MGEHIPLRIRGIIIDFYVYVDPAGAARKIARLEPVIARVPDEHLRTVHPIFIMKLKPGGREGGGTWGPEIVAANFMGTGQAANTGIPPGDIKLHVHRLRRGIIGVTEDRWNQVWRELQFTVLHEIAHCVDNALTLVPSGADSDLFNGMAADNSRCGSGRNALTRQAVEAYARYICSPGRVYHASVFGETPGVTNARLITALRSAPAFTRIPASWRPM